MLNEFWNGGGGEAPAGYAINRSLRFNSADSAYLDRTPSSAGNRRTWTWSGWVKRSVLGARQQLFSAPSSNTYIEWQNDALQIEEYSGSPVYKLALAAVQRDTSAWYHILVALDTTQATASNRIKIYINGVEQTVFSSASYPSQNHDSGINGAVLHKIGAFPGSGDGGNFYYLDGYMADIHFIDGQALTPSDFGETDSNGVWQPKKFVGSFNASYSSSYANFTTYGNIDAGSVNDLFDGNTGTTFEAGSTGGNIVFTPPGGIVYSSNVEVYTGRSTAQAVSLNGGSNVSTTSGWNTIASGSGTLASLTFSNGSAGNQSFSAIRVDGTILTTGTFTGVNGFHLDFSDGADLGNDSSGNNNDWTPNNLVGELATGDQGMDVVTYTGNGGTQTISGLKFQPDFIWTSVRDLTGYYKYVVDSVRGSTEYLVSFNADAESTDSQGITSITSDGFTVGSSTQVNENGRSMVAWAWKAGGAAVSNTDGTITSQVSANQTHGFSIVSYTGNNTAGATVGHGLGSAVKFLIVKSRSQSGQYWHVWHSSLANNEYMYLNVGDAKTSGNDFLNGTAPGSSTFTLGSGSACNKSSDPVIAYAWSEIAGFSKFGSYTGNSDNSTVTNRVIDCGFKPRWVMIKSSSTSGEEWMIYDSARNPTNPANLFLEADSSDAESSYQAREVSFVDNGFKFTGSNGQEPLNLNGREYVFAAFAAGGDGADLDSLLDTPEQRSDQTDSGSGGEIAGNYATWNPLVVTASGRTYSDGNLKCVTGIAEYRIIVPTIYYPTGYGKWYCEITVENLTADTVIGAIYASAINGEVNQAPGFVTNSVSYRFNGDKVQNSSSSAYGASYTDGDIIGVAFDAENGSITFYKNGVSQGVAFSSLSTVDQWALAASDFDNTASGTGTYVLNAGQRAFAYTAPSGYKALCIANLPDPTIADGSKYFDTKLYTGNGGTQSISTSFGPDFVWFKARSDAYSHSLFDVVRGVQKRLKTNSTDAEGTDATALTAFNSDGFTMGGSSSTNLNNDTYVAWAWDGGSSTVTNTDGSISAQVRANPSAGFSMCKITTPSSDGAYTFGHGLNAVPKFVFYRIYDQAMNWYVHSGSLNANEYLLLNSTSSKNSNDFVFNNTYPTNSVISDYAGDSSHHNEGREMLYYCFAPVAGYSAFGSYTGNGSADGPFVYTGHRSRWLMVKRSDFGANDWYVLDTARSTYNVAIDELLPNSSSAENPYTGVDFDLLSNGFKIRATEGSINAPGGTFIYAAFAEHPFKTSRAR